MAVRRRAVLWDRPGASSSASATLGPSAARCTVCEARVASWSPPNARTGRSVELMKVSSVRPTNGVRRAGCPDHPKPRVLIKSVPQKVTDQAGACYERIDHYE